MPDVVAASSAAADAANAIVNFFNIGISSIVTICFCLLNRFGIWPNRSNSCVSVDRSAAPCGDAGCRRSFCTEILRKAFLRTSEMFAHRDAGGLGIARDNGIADRPVLGQRRAPGLRVLEIMRELGEVRIEPLVEQLADDADQHGVVEAS